MFGQREGAFYLGGGTCRFSVWAPHHESVEVHVHGKGYFPLGRDRNGYFRAQVEGVRPGSLYTYRLPGDREMPDPASLHQPEGVHGPSQVIDVTQFAWNDRNWAGIAWEDLVIYELHVGTFTPDGTLDAVMGRLPYLRDLGITAVELMPLSQFPGERNWGYDGVFPYAVHTAYGGPAALQRLVDACHGQGMAVILDVVYNHLGPEGNVLPQYGPYFTDKYQGPWGRALNFDGPYSDQVRRFFIDNAVHWVKEFHLDGLRLDAVHAIYDQSASPFLRELASEVKEVGDMGGRQVLVIAESDLNDPRVLMSPSQQGYGMDGQWNDDFHHALHGLLTGERAGYYRDYGELEHLSQAYRRGFVYRGDYSKFRKRRHGAPLPGELHRRLVVFSQNHDQVGNRQKGERLTELVSGEKCLVAAGAVLLSPFIPLLFMGEEYGETAPFQYFTSHGDAKLVQAVTEGRRREFDEFDWSGETPDPQAAVTFFKSRLTPDDQGERGAERLMMYRGLLAWRRYMRPSRGSVEVSGDHAGGYLTLHQRGPDREFFTVLHFGDRRCAVELPPGRWYKRFDTSGGAWPYPPGDRGEAPRVGSQWVESNSCNLYEKMGGLDPA